MAKAAKATNDQTVADDAPVSETTTKKRMSDDTRAEIMSHLTAGAPVAALSREFGFSVATIGNIKREMNGGSPVAKSARSTKSTKTPASNDLKTRLMTYAVNSLRDPSKVTEAEITQLQADLESNVSKIKADLEAELLANLLA